MKPTWGRAWLAFLAALAVILYQPLGALVTACIVLVLLPPRYDPAIRLKEWQERRRRS